MHEDEDSRACSCSDAVLPEVVDHAIEDLADEGAVDQAPERDFELDEGGVIVVDHSMVVVQARAHNGDDVAEARNDLVVDLVVELVEDGGIRRNEVLGAQFDLPGLGHDIEHGRNLSGTGPVPV